MAWMTTVIAALRAWIKRLWLAVCGKAKREPRPISGRRGPKRGGRGPRQPPLSRPELVCRKGSASPTWEVVLSADEGCKVTEVRLGDEFFDFGGRRCRVPSLRGRLAVSCRDGRKHDVPLFEGDPLVFKMRRNWAGEGRRVSRLTSGHFIVLAPAEWHRTGRVSVEPDGFADPEFRVHYFHRDSGGSGESVGGFREWDGSFAADVLELTGRRVHDDSEEGTLFVGDPPALKVPPNVAWARVGEEAKNGWGENFQPASRSLPEVLGGRGGRFFFRVYDSQVDLLGSEAFRYLPDLARIDVDGKEYAPDTVLVPAPTGYSRTEVRLVGADGATLSPTLPSGALQTVEPSGAIGVPPHPDADRVSCGTGPDVRGADIVLDLPRIWWRLEDGRSDPGAWRDTPLGMTREEFRKLARSNASLFLLSRRFESVGAGFDDEPGLPYRRTRDSDRIEIPLAHFANHRQIGERLREDARLAVDLDGRKLPIVTVADDPVPEIVSFAADPPAILAGQEAVLEWTIRNADDARVTLDPNAGVVESRENRRVVRPAETTRYTLVLSVPGNDVSATVMIAVASPPGPGGRPVVRVRSPRGGWRSGKGFSFGELRAAGLTDREAAHRSIPVDRRRRTVHPANVEALGRTRDA